MTPGRIRAASVAAPWGRVAADPVAAGTRRRLVRLLVAAPLLVHLQLAGGNPWGIPADPDGSRDAGARDLRPPGPDWIQGTNTPAGADRAPVPGDSAPVPFGRSPDADRSPPVWNGGWSPPGAAGPGGQPPGPGAPAYRLRSDTGGEAPSAPTGVGPPGYADAPAPPAAGYRFRGDPPHPGGSAGAWPDPGAYRFRPLTEREQGRQGQGAGARPVDPGQGPRHPSGAPPVWPPGVPPGWENGPWPSR